MLLTIPQKQHNDLGNGNPETSFSGNQEIWKSATVSGNCILKYFWGVKRFPIPWICYPYFHIFRRTIENDHRWKSHLCWGPSLLWMISLLFVQGHEQNNKITFLLFCYWHRTNNKITKFDALMDQTFDGSK